MSTADGLSWRKSSRSSGANNDACVEVAPIIDVVAVRDSKNQGGPVLAVPSVTWRAFLDQLR
jgi:hypothetical protein